jgi:hypothetical protein
MPRTTTKMMARTQAAAWSQWSRPISRQGNDVSPATQLCSLERAQEVRRSRTAEVRRGVQLRAEIRLAGVSDTFDLG